MRRRVVRRKLNRSPPPPETGDQLRESLKDAREAFMERRKREENQAQSENDRVIEQILSHWYEKRVLSGAYDILHNHRCSRVECGDTIELIGNEKHRLYGCPKSGLYHACGMNSSCGLPAPSSGYRGARRNFYFKEFSDGGIYCMFSRVFCTRMIGEDNGEGAQSDDEFGVVGDYGDEHSESDCDDDGASGRENDPPAQQTVALVPASPLAGTKRPHSPAATETPAGGASPERSPPRPLPRSSDMDNMIGPEQAARMQMEQQYDTRARKEKEILAQKDSICKRVRDIVMKLCYSQLKRRRMRDQMQKDMLAEYHSKVSSYISHCKAVLQRPTVDVIVKIYRTVFCEELPPESVPSPDDGEPGRISAVVFRAWLLVNRVNVMRENNRSIGLVQFVLGVLYFMCSGYTMSDQTAGLAERRMNTGSFGVRRPPGALAALTAGPAPRLLTAGPADTEQMMALTPFDAESFRGPGSGALTTGGQAVARPRTRIALGSRLSEFSDASREYTILPAVDMLRDHLPPQKYLWMFSSKQRNAKASMVTRGQAIFEDAIHHANMSPREISEFILNIK